MQGYHQIILTQHSHSSGWNFSMRVLSVTHSLTTYSAKVITHNSIVLGEKHLKRKKTQIKVENPSHNNPNTRGSVEYPVELGENESLGGADIFLLIEWEAQPWAERVTLSSVIGWRNPKPDVLKLWFSRIDWNIGIKVAIISSAERHATMLKWKKKKTSENYLHEHKCSR